jgi:lipopolysaccharide export system protein LptC
MNRERRHTTEIALRIVCCKLRARDFERSFMATPLNVRPAQLRFGGITAAPDRTQAFRAARRHSAIVRLLKMLLPLGALGVVALYILPSQLSIRTRTGEASVQAIDVNSGGIRMVNPRIKGVHEKYGVYDIRADSSVQHVDDPELMNFEVINAEIVSPKGQKTVLTAPSGIYQTKKEEMTFNNGVDIGGDSGISGKLKTATAFMQENRLVSKDPVQLAYHGHTILADSAEVWTSENRAVFTGNVKVHLERAQTEGKQQ